MPDVTGPAAWITAARARAEAATPGPYGVYDRGVGFYITVRGDGDKGKDIFPEGHRTDLARREDAEAIAGALNDLPAALDALREVLRICDEADPQGLGANAAGYSDALDAVRAVITDTLRSTR